MEETTSSRGSAEKADAIPLTTMIRCDNLKHICFFFSECINSSYTAAHVSWMNAIAANGNFMRLFRSSSAPVVRSSRDWGVVDTRHTLLMANKSSKILSAISSFDERSFFIIISASINQTFVFMIVIMISTFWYFHILHPSLLFSPYPVRIIFLRSKIIIIAAPKVLMVSETKRLKVMIRPRRRVSFTEVDIWIILIFFWHVRERDFRLRC